MHLDACVQPKVLSIGERGGALGDLCHRDRPHFARRFREVDLPGWAEPSAAFSLDGTCTRDPNMNLIIQYGLLGLGFIYIAKFGAPWHYRTCAHSRF